MTPKTFLQLFIVLAGMALGCQAGAAVNDSGAKEDWSYVGTTGPAHWGMLSTVFEACDIGKTQSPIDIGRRIVDAKFDLNMHYHPSPMVIGEDMDTRLDISNKQTIVNMGHGLQLNFHGDRRELVAYNGQEYELIQLHFHSPSETLWHKQSFPLEIHFVHQGKNDVLVIAVFVKGGGENEVLKTILAHVPDDKKQEHAVKGVSVNPAGLLPEDLRYYAFDGSLTTPPCTEGIHWLVLKQPVTASPAQILNIRKASGGTNARPVQPLNGRTIYYAVP